VSHTEEMSEPALEPGQVALDLPQNLGGDEVAAAALRGDDDGLLGPLGGRGIGRDGGGGGGGARAEAVLRG